MEFGPIPNSNKNHTQTTIGARDHEMPAADLLPVLIRWRSQSHPLPVRSQSRPVPRSGSFRDQSVSWLAADMRGWRENMEAPDETRATERRALGGAAVRLFLGEAEQRVPDEKSFGCTLSTHTLGRVTCVEQKDVAQNHMTCVGGTVTELQEIHLMNLQQPDQLDCHAEFKHYSTSRYRNVRPHSASTFPSG